jgi:hypothetical protein
MEHFQRHLQNQEGGWSQTLLCWDSESKKVHLCLGIVEYRRGGSPPLYELIIGKQTLHDIGAVLDFKERTITIDEIILHMRNINNLQLKPNISRALNLIPALPRNQWLHVMPPNGSWKSWMLNMTKQTFQAM